MKLHLLSNGNGEDQIAGHIGLALLEQNNTIQLNTFPLVGNGNEYLKLGFNPEFNNKPLPSGGFLRSIKHILDDLRHGIIGQHSSQLKQLKRQAMHADAALCVGDFFCLIMGRLAGYKHLIFFPTAKSDHFMSHDWIERWLMKRWSQLIFTRDELTAETLRNHGLAAQYCGNPMFDKLVPSDHPIQLPTADRLVGLLPGSRQEALKNLNYLLTILPDLAQTFGNTHFIVAKASALSLDNLELPTNWTRDQETLRYKDQPLATISESFSDVLHQSQIIIGLSGTGNEQAMYLGKPVVAFEGFGPQSSLLRFQEQNKLMGNQLLIAEKRELHAIQKKCQDAFDRLSGNTAKKSTEEKAAQRIAKQVLQFVSTS